MVGGRPKGGKDNPTNQRKLSHQTVVQQKAINKKNSKAKKDANAKAKQQVVLKSKDKAKKERPTTSFFDQRQKKPAVARNKLLYFGAPSLDPNGQAVDKTHTPVNIKDKPKPSKVNDKIANNQATKNPVMLTKFLSHPSIKTFDPKDINPNFNELEEAKDINDKDWEGLENNDNDNGTSQDSNNQAQQAELNSLFSSFFLSFFFFSLLFLLFPSFLLTKKTSTNMDPKPDMAFSRYLWSFLINILLNDLNTDTVFTLRINYKNDI